MVARGNTKGLAETKFQRVPFFVNSKERGWFLMSNGGYQRPIKKIPSGLRRQSLS